MQNDIMCVSIFAHMCIRDRAFVIFFLGGGVSSIFSFYFLPIENQIFFFSRSESQNIFFRRKQKQNIFFF